MEHYSGKHLKKCLSREESDALIKEHPSQTLIYVTDKYLSTLLGRCFPRDQDAKLNKIKLAVLAIAHPVVSAWQGLIESGINEDTDISVPAGGRGTNYLPEDPLPCRQWIGNHQDLFPQFPQFQRFWPEATIPQATSASRSPSCKPKDPNRGNNGPNQARAISRVQEDGTGFISPCSLSPIQTGHGDQ